MLSAAPMTLTVLLHSALAAPLLHSAGAVHQGDLHITGHHYYRDQTLSVNGSVILEPGGSLELHNTTLEVLCTYDRQFNLSWFGGSLTSRKSTIGGRLRSGLCGHTNFFVYDGSWDSEDDSVQCSYGILFSDDTVGTVVTRRLTAGVAPDSMIMGGRGNVTMIDSLYSLNLKLAVAPGSAVALDLPAGVALTKTYQPAGTDWTLALKNTTNTHWFLELDPVVDASQPKATFTFSERTSPFNLHLHTGTHASGGLSGDFTVSHMLDKPVAVGNVVLQSAAADTPARVAAYEMYVTTTAASDSLTIRGIEQGGENMIWGPGMLTLEGKGRKVTNIGCTTCNVGGKGAGSGYGTMVLRHTSIGPRGGHNRGQVLVRGGGGAFIAHDVEINDLGVLLEGAQSSLRADDCDVAGAVEDLHGGGSLTLNCSR